jgi:hypothetical protein
MVDVRMRVTPELGDSDVHFVIARVADVSKDNESLGFFCQTYLYSWFILFSTKLKGQSTDLPAMRYLSYAR